VCSSDLLSPGAASRAPEVALVDDRRVFVKGRGEESRIPGDTPLMLCTNWASRANYGHWLMNTLFSIHLAMADLEAGRLRLLCPPLTERQRNEILALGTPRAAIVETGAHYARAARLLYPSPLATYSNMQLQSRGRAFLDALRRRLGSDAPDAPERVYLSREGFPSARAMTNEGALQDALSALGFCILRPHDLSLSEQIALLSRAKIVVGQFGAALWNLPFMPAGGTVVEIATENYVSNEYLYVAHHFGLRFHRVMIPAPATGVDAYQGAAFAFEAPVAEIVALAARLTAS
jgi:capsular polysaccharide biosynthesis protein